MNASGRTLKSITVADLISLLQDQDLDALVIFSTDYGDYHHTPQALRIKGETEEVLVEPSAYSNSGFAVSSMDEDEGEEEYQKYLLIK